MHHVTCYWVPLQCLRRGCLQLFEETGYFPYYHQSWAFWKELVFDISTHKIKVNVHSAYYKKKKTSDSAEGIIANQNEVTKEPKGSMVSTEVFWVDIFIYPLYDL